MVRNEFTVRDGGGKGSRGSTPGLFVERYMAREGASESLPVVRDTPMDDFEYVYKTRKKVAEETRHPYDVRNRVENVAVSSGKMFGTLGFSYSREELEEARDTIQNSFDNGKTVHRFVISFDDEFLKEHHILPKDAVGGTKGCWAGLVDQARLREAVSEGMRNMGRGYDDLYWSAVIQVDTEHVHVHVASVDLGVGKIHKPTGQQRGVINEVSKQRLRRGISRSLNDLQGYKHLAQGKDYSEQNVLGFVKSQIYKQACDRSFMQFLVSCLPDEKRLWRASSHRAEMQKANMVARNLVKGYLNLPESGYYDVLRSIEEYSIARVERDGLPAEEHRRYVEAEVEGLVRRGVDSLYSWLRSLPEEELRVTSSQAYDVLSLDMNRLDLARPEIELDENGNEVSQISPAEFGFRLRLYTQRLDEHTQEATRCHNLCNKWESEFSSGMARPWSVAAYTFYDYEEKYHRKCMAKYQSMLLPTGNPEAYRKDVDELDRLGRLWESYLGILQDKSILKMTPERAEEYGIQVYGVRGAHLMKDKPKLVKNRADRAYKSYENALRDLQFKFTKGGISFSSRRDDEEDAPIGRRRFRMEFEFKPEFKFDDVKALDLHRMGKDVPYDMTVSANNVAAFVEEARIRHSLCFAAAKAFTKVGYKPEDLPQLLPIDDVVEMWNAAKEYETMATVHINQTRERDENAGLYEHLTIDMGSSILDSIDGPMLAMPEANVHTTDEMSATESSDELDEEYNFLNYEGVYEGERTSGLAVENFVRQVEANTDSQFSGDSLLDNIVIMSENELDAVESDMEFE